MKINFLNPIISALYPKKCVFCGEIIDENDDVCSYCLKKIKRINTEKRCSFCGHEKDNCLCKRFVYHFREAVSVFYYDDFTKRGILNLKFHQKQQNANYFCKQMAANINRFFGDKEIDFICFVPRDKHSVREYGIDQSEILAKKLSKLLCIPIISALKVKKRRPKQHDSNFEQRFKNVKSKYSATMDIGGYNILLIDDIMTTGATLDECARILLFAGAKEIYVCTALSTPILKKEDKK